MAYFSRCILVLVMVLATGAAPALTCGGDGPGRGVQRGTQKSCCAMRGAVMDGALCVMAGCRCGMSSSRGEPLVKTEAATATQKVESFVTGAAAVCAMVLPTRLDVTGGERSFERFDHLSAQSLLCVRLT